MRIRRLAGFAVAVAVIGASGTMTGTAAQGMKEGQGGMMHGHGAGTAPMDAKGADDATTRWSDKRMFEVSYEPSPRPVHVNALHTWTLVISDAAGRPVSGAQVSVDGGMPAHGHGLPTAPQVKSLGEGRYLLEGIKFQMPGQWVVTLHIVSGGAADSVTFHLKLE